MRLFWMTKISWKGVLKNHLIWTGPQSCPNISLYPDYDTYDRKQTNSSHLMLRSGRGVSLFPPLQGSITVEAAFALPLFLFFCIQLLSLISLFQLHSALEAALHQETAQAALQAYAYQELGIDISSGAGGFLEEAYLRDRVINRVGKAYLDHSMIEGGSSNIHILYTGKKEVQDTVDVILYYKIQPAVDILGFSGFTMANRCRMKAWTGYQAENAAASGKTGEELVYITETGTVYHKSRNCSHLALSVRTVKTGSLNELRNGDGGKYYPCEKCGKNAGSSVFITEQGNRYHTSLNCSGLKRTVYVVPISEAGGRGPCSRCSVTG